MKRLGIIGRFKPLHNAAASLLEQVCRSADEVVIGIGSSNRYDVRNPFTAAQTRDMIDAYLSSRANNYTVVEVPDFGHIPQYRDGQRWKQEVIAQFGELDAFVTDNAYVRALLADTYTLRNAREIAAVDPDLCASRVRQHMAVGTCWENMVPKEVADYLRQHHLVERFRKEFGQQTRHLAYKARPSAAEEHANIGVQ